MNTKPDWDLENDALERENERLRQIVSLGEDQVTALERQVRDMRSALEKISAECSTFPIKDGLAFRCESIARNALT